MTTLSKIINERTNFSYPITKQFDIIFKLGKNIVVLVDCSNSRHFNYHEKEELLNAYDFYDHEYIKTLEFTKPILCTIQQDNDYKMFCTNEENDIFFAVKNDYELICKKYNQEINNETNFLEDLLDID